MGLAEALALGLGGAAGRRCSECISVSTCVLMCLLTCVYYSGHALAALRVGARVRAVGGRAVSSRCDAGATGAGGGGGRRGGGVGRTRAVVRRGWDSGWTRGVGRQRARRRKARRGAWAPSHLEDQPCRVRGSRDHLLVRDAQVVLIVLRLLLSSGAGLGCRGARCRGAGHSRPARPRGRAVGPRRRRQGRVPVLLRFRLDLRDGCYSSTCRVAGWLRLA